MTELNRTTELSQTKTAAPSGRELQTRDSLTISSLARPSDPSAENVNELTGNWKQTNTFQSSSGLEGDLEGYIAENSAQQQQQKQWYINEFGELVINKATQYSAGKYTCLAGGRQSEVLLDVLMDSFPDKGSEQAFTMEDVRFERASSDVKVETSAPIQRMVPTSKTTESSSVSVEASSTESSPLNYDDHGAGNGPIERNWQMPDSGGSTKRESNSPKGDNENDYEATTKAENGNGLNPLSVDKDSSLSGPNSIKTLEGDAENKFEPGQARLFPTDEMPAKSINGPSSLDMRATLDDNTNWGDIWGLEDARLNSKKINNATKWRFMPQYRHHPVHLVKTETIQAEDLKLVPGFLYTKHRLNCPVTGQKAHREHIHPLARALCSISVNWHGPKLSAGDTDKLKCYHLVKRLVAEILGGTWTESETGQQQHRHPGDCYDPLLEVEWFKNGERLEFDTNGRARDISLNLKLIDFFEQFSVTSNSTGADSTNNADAGTGNREDSIEAGTEARDVRRAAEVLEAKPSSPSRPQIKWTCPLKGRTLEIDGVRKESAGRYTCALRLSISKLDRIIQNLQRLNEAQWATKRSAAAPHDNDISSCDEPSPFGCHARSQDEQQSSSASGTRIESWQTIKSPTGSNVPNLEGTPERVANNLDSIILAGGDSPARRAALLESILKRTLAKKPALIYIKQLLSRLRNSLTSIQTFSVVVSERAGKFRSEN